MCASKFSFLDKQKLDAILPDLFAILHANMTLIAPTGNSYQADFVVWRSYIVPDLQNECRQIVLMYEGNTLAGFFRYCIHADSLMMEEIQIQKAFQGTGLFSAFYKWLVQQLPNNLLYVEAYAHKQNYKSQAVLEHLGLVRSGENKNGLSFRYKGDYADLLRKYS